MYVAIHIIDHSLNYVNIILDFFRSNTIYQRSERMILKKISKLCKERGISIAKLERETGISNGTIGRWDTSSPNVNNLAAVANYFGVSIDSLVKEEGQE